MPAEEIDRRYLIKLEAILKAFQEAAPDIAALEVRPNKKSLTNAKSKLRAAMNMVSDLSVELTNLIPKD